MNIKNFQGVLVRRGAEEWKNGKVKSKESLGFVFLKIKGVR